MRTIGNLANESAAARFSAYLFVRGIENEFEEDEGVFALWIFDDANVAKAAELLVKFRENPDAAEFKAAADQAQKQRRAEEEALRAQRSTVADSARLGYERHFLITPYVTYALMLISVAVAIYSGAGDDWKALRFLSITEVRVTEQIMRWIPGLPELRMGQIWRLVTPIFIHFGLLHIAFNLMLFKDLGTFVESRFGGRYLILLVIATAALSNIAQYLWSGPTFGGMSGVDYALFGFLWMRGKHDPTSNWQINKNTVYALVGWFVICLAGIIPNVANMCHAVGLGAGMLWGYLSAGRLFSR